MYRDNDETRVPFEPGAIVLPADLLPYASDWHGGQASALYSVLSTGRLYSWSVADGLAYELRDTGQDDERRAALKEWADDLLTVNPYAAGWLETPDPGNYLLAAVTDDGDTLCERCVRDASNPVYPASWRDGAGDGWGVVGWTTSGETDGLEYCAHCGRDWTGHGE